MKRLRSRSGFTLIEITLTALVLVVMAKFTIDALQGLHATTTESTTQSRIQQNGEQALLAIIADLNASGFVTNVGVASKSYPFMFEEGVTGDANFANHDHAPAHHRAVQGDPDFGPSQEIVFLRPADANGDEVPDVDPATGKLVFDAREFSYALITDPSGRNVLERRTDAAKGVPVAYDVERIRFDGSTTSGQHQPTNSVRVRIWFRALDENGALQRYTAEATVRLRNGE